MKRSRQLGEESINKLLVKFSVPAIIGMLVNSLYNIVDRIFVGNGVGSLGLSAITVEFPLTLVVMSVALLIGVGSGTLISIRLGEKKESEAGEILGNAFFLLVILSVLITVVGLAWLDPLMSLLGASAEVLPYARDYAGIILAGTVFWTVGMGMNNIIRAEGNPQVAMLTMLIGALLNIVLDAVFIFAFGWGIKGAALATIIAKAVSTLWVLHYLLTRSQVRLRLDKIRLRLAHMLRIVAIGFAPFARQLAASLLNVILNISLSTYGGDLALAAMGVVMSLSTLIFMPIIGLDHGLQPIIGYNHGARNFHRVREAFVKGLVVATAVSVLGFIVINLFPAQLVAMFNAKDAELIALGSRALRIYLLLLPVIGAQIIGSSYFQAVGRPVPAAILTLSRQVLILIPALLILPPFFGLNGVFYAGPTADFVATVLTGLWVAVEMRKLTKKEREMAPTPAR